MKEQIKIIIGAQWGDEGKGKITDIYAKDADFIVRYQGGNNAGHTVCIDKEVFAFHLLPSGILQENKTSILGNGVVVNLQILSDEINRLKERRMFRGKLLISDRAHIILPLHSKRDVGSEKKKGSMKIGTTGRGIGPCYADKSRRVGIRMHNLLYPKRLLHQLKDLYGTSKATEIFKKYIKPNLYLSSFIVDTGIILDNAIKKGKSIILEGAQGTLLDIDHGTYPYVTSSSPSVGGAFTGSGLNTSYRHGVTGVVKAYTTRVGEGPFPTEQLKSAGNTLRKTGGEYGTTTGRPRRCGWLDIALLKYATRINGFSAIALTKLDVLSSFKEIPVATHYELNGKKIDYFPADIELVKKCNPVYKAISGWEVDITDIRSYNKLPDAAKRYIEMIEKEIGVPVTLISVGPGRSETIIK